ATMGEAIHESQVVVVVDCNPNELRPRFFKQLMQKSASSYFLGCAQAAKWGAELTDSIQVESKHDLEQLFLSLDAVLKGTCCRDVDSRLAEWASIWKKSRGVLFLVNCQSEPSGDSEFEFWLDHLVSAAKSLNRYGRARVLNLSQIKNGQGAENYLVSRFGFPAALNLGSNQPESWGEEFKSFSVIEERETDAVISFGQTLDDVGLGDFDELTEVRFCWGDVSQNRAKSSRCIEFWNVSPLPDDFVRFDELTYSIGSQNGNSRSPMSLLLDELRRELLTARKR
ncbi:MAG: hypothetical protein AAGA30_05585, partial [Planctomycetota bacterium]